MNKAKIIAAALVGAAMAYLGVAFICWDLNAVSWGQDARACAFLLMLLMGGVSSGVAAA